MTPVSFSALKSLAMAVGLIAPLAAWGAHPPEGSSAQTKHASAVFSPDGQRVKSKDTSRVEQAGDFTVICGWALEPWGEGFNYICD